MNGVLAPLEMTPHLVCGCKYSVLFWFVRKRGELKMRPPPLSFASCLFLLCSLNAEVIHDEAYFAIAEVVANGGTDFG